jgi:peptidoglycan/LPS O-acetylase OafA/YrhL
MPAPGNKHGPNSIPSLDGIRAVAVLIVFIGHSATAPLIWPGNVGVTIFFFLSGYLITTLLRREWGKTGRISLSKFYLRRALRILPPAYITIAIAVILGATGVLAATTTVWGVLAEGLNLTNYYLIFFGRDGLPPETSMLWSLAVEEHFYLIFPAILIVLLRKRLTRITIGRILLVACGVGLLWRIALTLGGASFFHLYTGTDTRFDGLLAGAAMALLWNPTTGDSFPFRIDQKVIARVLVPVAVVVMVGSALIQKDAIRLSVVDTVQYVCLIPIFWFVITQPTSWVGRILNYRVVAHIGVLSFSIYLLHRLAVALVAPLSPINPVRDIVALALTIAAAEVMYRLVEDPLAKVRRRLEVRLPVREPRKVPDPAV